MIGEDDYLILSDIHNYAVCPRRWALRAVEGKYCQTWRTISGDKVHLRAHDATQVEKRGDIITMRGLKVVSHALRISGECDVVEFVKDEKGVELNGYEGKYSPMPIEYKRGIGLEDTDFDLLQLCAQGMCLEEMLLCEINKGALFYAQTHRRVIVDFDADLRGKVVAIAKDIHKYLEAGYTPKPKITRFCNECSLKNECLPVLAKKTSVADYIKSRLGED